MKSLLNRKAVKEFSLFASKCRFHKFTRCSKSFLDSVEVELMSLIRKKIDSLPSKGVTL